MRNISRIERIIAFVLAAGLGASAAVFAILDQTGSTRGNSSLGLFFVTVLVALALAIAGVVVLSQGKQIQNAVPIAKLMFAATFTLPASYLSVLFIARKYYGE